MDTESGRFVGEAEATVDMNKYQKGQLIVITGDVFRVADIGNHYDRGRLVLVALDRGEREVEAKAIKEQLLKGYAISTPNQKPRNRAERRKAERVKRRSGKRSRG